MLGNIATHPKRVTAWCEATLDVLRPVLEERHQPQNWNAAKDKCYVDKPETIDALKDNIREIQLHTIDNVFKN